VNARCWIKAFSVGIIAEVIDETGSEPEIGT